MLYLCNDIFLIIYSFVGHNALYLNKNYYDYLKKIRKEFFKNPIILKYRTISYKFPGIGITRFNYNTSRVSFRISNDIDNIFINGNTYLGTIKKNLNEIDPSYQLKLKIFKNPNIIYNFNNIYIKKNVYYFDLFKVFAVNIDRVKKYNKLWVSSK